MALTGYFNGTATTTYTYDAIGNMATTSGAATSTFMWDYRNRMVRAWVNGVASGTPTTYYYHPDHLGSTQAITNSAGVGVQALSYYPYGAQRINSGRDASDRLFIGQFADDATSLDYLNERYYDPARGQFMSQDPVFWEIGQTIDGKAVLQLPQHQNSYSYAGSTPSKTRTRRGDDRYHRRCWSMG